MMDQEPRSIGRCRVLIDQIENCSHCCVVVFACTGGEHSIVRVNNNCGVITSFDSPNDPSDAAVVGQLASKADDVESVLVIIAWTFSISPTHFIIAEYP